MQKTKKEENYVASDQNDNDTTKIGEVRSRTKNQNRTGRKTRNVSSNEIQEKRENPRVLKKCAENEKARRSMEKFAKIIAPTMEWTRFHEMYYRLLDEFATGRVKRIIVSVPPQHGKSRGASVILPAYMLGRDPELRIAVASYSFVLASRFGQDVQRVMANQKYVDVFPKTCLKGTGVKKNAQERTARRTAQEFDCVGAEGGLKLVGRTGSLTGNRVDVMISDDLYKDALEANSPLVRERVWEWYNAVVRTRLHDKSRELVVCTRWHEDDLIGRLMRTEKVVDLKEWAQLDELPRGAWVVVAFEALKASPQTQIDPRIEGEALWPGRHSVEWLMQRRSADPAMFEALFQGNPTVREGLLYGVFQLYSTLPKGEMRAMNYTDTADTGTDKLCSICYEVGAEDGLFYVRDVIYSTEPMEVTEVAVAGMIQRNGVAVALVESNNGGRGFGRAVERRLREANAKSCTVKMFHQKGNKESRILTHAATVTSFIRMPVDWRVRWPEFAADVCGFRRVFRANAHDDAPDALTGLVEAEIIPKGSKICHVGFGRR